MVECWVSYLKVPGYNPASNLNILVIFLCLSQSLPPPTTSMYTKSLQDKITQFSDRLHSILSFLHGMYRIRDNVMEVTFWIGPSLVRSADRLLLEDPQGVKV